MSRPLTLFLGVMLVAVSIAAAYFAVPKPELPPGLWPDRWAIDCGERSQGTTIRESVRLRNTYPVAVDVLELSKGCSCSSTSVTRTAIGPSEETILNVEWGLGAARGEITETVGVLYRIGPGNFDLVDVHLKATVQPDIVYEPRSLVFEPGQQAVVTVRFRPGRLASFRLKEATTNQAAFSAHLDPDRQEVVVAYDPTVPGADGPNIWLSVECDSPNEPRMRIPLLANRQPAAMEPPRVMESSPTKTP